MTRDSDCHGHRDGHRDLSGQPVPGRRADETVTGGRLGTASDSTSLGTVLRLRSRSVHIHRE
jgi:hypothetical protein